MDDREFSSQVCYMDFDHVQPEDPNARLCTRCQTVLAAFASSHLEISFHHFYTSNQPLEVTARAGCQLCRYLIKIMDSEDLQVSANLQARGMAESVEQKYFRSGYDLGNSSLWVQQKAMPSLGNSPDADYWWSSMLRIAMIPTEAVNGDHLGTSTDSKYATATVSKWLKECEDHASCQRAGRFLPTRLLSINPDGATARLASGKDLPSGTKYLTLSHCWGDTVPFRLLKDNLESMKDSILISHLPKTFRDAMKMTRCIGESYLWIDSLCIIQDDFNDWQIESALMDQVYSESHCNLSASAAETCAGGLFFRRDPLPKHRFQVSLNIDGTPKLYVPLDETYWRNSVEQAPLSSRGWALQERFLSPCNVHFTPNELFWECKKVSASELFPKGLPGGSGSWLDSGSKQDISPAFERDMTAVGSPHRLDLDWAWNTLLGKYTSSKLTFEGDKLVAIAGLARSYGAYSHDEYLAGLWRKHLPRALTWHCYTVLNEYDNRKYTGPSWSWASLDGEVTVESHREGFVSIQNPLVELIGTEIELVGQDPFGQVRRGCLTIKGSLALCHPQQSELTGIYCLEFPGTSGIPKRALDEAKDIEHVFWDFPIDQLCTSLEKMGIYQPISSLYLLPIYEIPHHLGKTYHGLVLWPTGENVGEFRRVAYFQWLSEECVRDQKFEKAMGSFDAMAAESGLRYEEEESGEIKYTITIV